MSASDAKSRYAHSGYTDVDQNAIVKVTNTGAIKTAGDNSDGIYAYAEGYGSVSVTNSGAITTAGVRSEGIRARSYYGAVTVTNEAAINTTGVDANGIHVDTHNGAVTITNKAAITTTGRDAGGIVAMYGMGTVNVDSTGTVKTEGDGSTGIEVRRQGGVIINAASVSTKGNDSIGIKIFGGFGPTFFAMGPPQPAVGPIDVTAGTVSTTGDNSAGIFVEAPQAAVKVTATDVTTAGIASNGIDVKSYDGITIKANSVKTTGKDSIGIKASAVAELTLFDMGSPAPAAGPIDVTAGTVSTTGDNSIGILAVSAMGDLTVTATDVSTTGMVSYGIAALRDSDSDGTVTVNSGSVNVTGADSVAIAAVNMNGAVHVSVAGSTRSATAHAIDVRGSAAIIDIAATGSVTGATNAIFAYGPATINNAGALNAGSAATISARYGPVNFTNSGQFAGYVQFGSDDDLITNSGTFALSGESTFGAGNNRFVNEKSGTVTMLGSAQLTGLTTFTNAGTISLANDVAGDTLTMSGDYVGAGGQIILDIGNAAPNLFKTFAGNSFGYDQIVIGGAATGTTQIKLRAVGQGPLTLAPGTQITLIDAAGGTASGAFTIAPEDANIGFMRFGLSFDATGDDFVIVATSGLGTYQTLKLNEGAQALWYKSTDVWSAHMTALRDSTSGQDASTRGRVWGQFHGSVDKRSEVKIVDAQNVDMSYRQDHFGAQMGVDLGAIDGKGVAYGVTAGYISSALKFTAANDRANYEGFNLGAYFGARQGNIFINALAKYDLFDVKARGLTTGYSENLDGKGYGAQIEAGARFGTKGFFVEPVVSLAYSRTDLESLAALGAVVDFDKLDGLRGKAGARIGGTNQLNGGTLTYYAGGHVVKELAGKDGIRFTAGGTTDVIANDPIDTYGQFQLGVNIASAAGVTGFIEGNANTSDDYKGYGGRVGIRLPF